VHDDAAAKEIQQAVGKRVTLHYEEKVGLPTNCFGETRHFVTRITINPDIPIGPGVTMQATPPPAALPAVPPAAAASQ
jgi:hypothetical protein